MPIVSQFYGIIISMFFNDTDRHHLPHIHVQYAEYRGIINMENIIEEMPTEVTALENFLLYIKFQNGEEKIYDMKEMLKFDYYKNLRSKENFKKVKVYGITLKWSTGEDIAPEKIYFNSIPIQKFKSEIKKME
ncbi:MAG: DUF2442 domain-containing protein [Clostridia bacterium]|nr:DUF2442 domain-containing protein [Clostridia bacterium]